MGRRLAYWLFPVVAVAFGTPGAAQACLPMDKGLHALQAQHQEYVVASGLIANGHQMVMTASDKGSWTLLAITPFGCTQTVMVGQHYAPQDIPPIGKNT